MGGRGNSPATFISKETKNANTRNYKNTIN